MCQRHCTLSYSLNPTDELESLLKDKSSPSSTTSPPANTDTSVETPSRFEDFGVLQGHGGSSAGDASIDITTFYSHTNGDGSVQMDLPFGDSHSMDHLTSIANFMDDIPPQTAHITSVSPTSTPSAESQKEVNGLASTANSLPDTLDFGLLYLSWPANLPDLLTTRHL